MLENCSDAYSDEELQRTYDQVNISTAFIENNIVHHVTFSSSLDDAYCLTCTCNGEEKKFKKDARTWLHKSSDRKRKHLLTMGNDIEESSPEKQKKISLLNSSCKQDVMNNNVNECIEEMPQFGELFSSKLDGIPSIRIFETQNGNNCYRNSKTISDSDITSLADSDSDLVDSDEEDDTSKAKDLLNSTPEIMNQTNGEGNIENESCTICTECGDYPTTCNNLMTNFSRKAARSLSQNSSNTLMPCHDESAINLCGSDSDTSECCSIACECTLFSPTFQYDSKECAFISSGETHACHAQKRRRTTNIKTENVDAENQEKNISVLEEDTIDKLKNVNSGHCMNENCSNLQRVPCLLELSRRMAPAICIEAESYKDTLLDYAFNTTSELRFSDYFPTGNSSRMFQNRKKPNKRCKSHTK